MHQEDFEHRHRGTWQTLEELLNDYDQASRDKPLDKERQAQLPMLYRRVCNHYALARSRRYSPLLTENLQQLILRGHQRLYKRRSNWLWRLIVFIARDFPQSLRDQWRYMALSTALFLVPGIALGLACFYNPDLIYSVMDSSQVGQMEQMYDPSNRQAGRIEGRDADSDFLMFGHYISNNIGIGFRTFASGILAGIGTIFFLVFNGVVIGSVAGHLTQLGYTGTFWSFVSGHSSLELTAIVICGAAGLMLARAIWAPGQYRRMDAIKRQGHKALPLVMGAALMLLGAAFIEAFWSSSGVDNAVKYTVSAALWTLMILYFVFAGRSSRGS